MRSNNKKTPTKYYLPDLLWDLWCICSIVGIWPRFIEPKLLKTTHLTLPIPNLSDPLQGLKLVQFSDLHFHPRLSDKFLQKLINKIQKENPDIIVFTGDFLCYSSLLDKERIEHFLNQFHAPLGCYAVYGNHDYQKTVTVNEKGDYDILNDSSSLITKAMKRFITSPKLSGKISDSARTVPPHQGLTTLLQKTSFQLLDNQTHLIPIMSAGLNLTGVGEYMFGRCKPEQAFQGYHKKLPGIVLAHNPDCIPMLNKYPGDIILCGHTHGGQANLPLIRKKFLILENMEYQRGLTKSNEKWIYTNRGIGSVMPFRWFSIPEILALTLERGS